MNKFTLNKILLLTSIAFPLLFSCNKKFEDNNYTAYFGGEISNPRSSYILFYKGEKLIDTINLDQKNRFFVKFDSLTPGLYTFKHHPEYQYVYFDKNDSLMVRMNANELDESIVYCGHGEEKNNFLMEMYLKNHNDQTNMYSIFDHNPEKFNKIIDSSYKIKEKFYNQKKQDIKWNKEFDVYAKASLDFSHYLKKEIYAQAHAVRTGKKNHYMPKNFYDYREQINFNDVQLNNFSPFLVYLNAMINNIALEQYTKKTTPAEDALSFNITKLNITDSLIKNEKIKNNILNNIAFIFLIEDQNIINNNDFLERYYQLSTNDSQQNEIKKIGDAVLLLNLNSPLPIVKLTNEKNEIIDLNALLNNKKTVIFFWTSKAKSHLEAAHRKAKMLQTKYPEVQFLAINIEDSPEDWKKLLNQYNFDGITELRAKDFKEIKDKWVITKIQRVMVTNPDATIKRSFTNLFNVKFEEDLK